MFLSMPKGDITRQLALSYSLAALGMLALMSTILALRSKLADVSIDVSMIVSGESHAYYIIL